MNKDPDALLAQLEHHGAALRKLAEQIAAELSKGRKAPIEKVDILRPQIMQHLAVINKTVLECGFVDPANRSAALFDAINFYRPQASYWSKADLLLRDQLPPRARPFDVTRPAADHSTIQAQACEALLDRLHFALKPGGQSEEARANDCFDDIPLRATHFFEALHAAYRVLLVQGKTRNASFIDVGCGNGMKLISAAPFFERCDGVEYQADFAAAARDLMRRAGLPNCDVHQGDARGFERYGAYSVIYLYRPIRDDDGLKALEDRILQTATPGTLLIAPYGQFSQRGGGADCAAITDDVYLIGGTQEEADHLRDEASFTGFGMQHRKPAAASLWEPIFEVSAARGFVP